MAIADGQQASDPEPPIRLFGALLPLQWDDEGKSESGAEEKGPDTAPMTQAKTQGVCKVGRLMYHLQPTRDQGGCIGSTSRK